MPFVQANAQEEEKGIKEMIDSDPELAKFAENWDREYEFRKKLALARKEVEPAQKELRTLSELNYRTVSRSETSTDNEPSLKPSSSVRY